MNLNVAQAQDFYIPGPTDENSRSYGEGDVIPPGGRNESDSYIEILSDSPTLDATEGILGAGILLLLLIIFFFIKRGIENNLITSMVSPKRAVFASWLFFLMMFCIAVTAVATFLTTPPLWGYPKILSSVIAVDTIAIIAAVMALISARRSTSIT